MFMVGPPSSTNSKPCSRSATPSSDSGHSTASELPVDPVTPPSASSPTATAWSDDDETPVLPRTRKLSELSLKSDSEHESGGNSKLQVLIKEAEDMIKSWEPNVWDDPTTEKLAPQDHVDIYEKLRVEPQPPVAIHSAIQPSREAWGLPPLQLRCAHDKRRHPMHIYTWNTLKLNCYQVHESDCDICGASCCSVQAFTKAINKEPGPNPLVPNKYREAFQRDIDDINAIKPQATDPFERMLTCDTCYRNVCPDCAGRCMRPACLQIICVKCGGDDPWASCECQLFKGKMKISYM